MAVVVAPQNPFKNVYMIRSRPNNNVMTCRTQEGQTLNTSQYTIGFLNKNEADHIHKFISPTSNVLFAEYSPSSVSLVRIEKKIDINYLPCYIHTKDLKEFMKLPLEYNINILFCTDIIEETKTDFIIEAITYEANTTTASFAKSLVLWDSNELN